MAKVEILKNHISFLSISSPLLCSAAAVLFKSNWIPGLCEEDSAFQHHMMIRFFHLFQFNLSSLVRCFFLLCISLPVYRRSCSFDACLFPSCEFWNWVGIIERVVREGGCLGYEHERAAWKNPNACRNEKMGVIRRFQLTIAKWCWYQHII